MFNFQQANEIALAVHRVFSVRVSLVTTTQHSWVDLFQFDDLTLHFPPSWFVSIILEPWRQVVMVLVFSYYDFIFILVDFAILYGSIKW